MRQQTQQAIESNCNHPAEQTNDFGSLHWDCVRLEGWAVGFNT
jgi:hypothetical protein